MNFLVKNKTLIRVIACMLIIVAVCFKVFTFRFGVLDELWPYDLSKAITMGYIPYRDYPIISMPLFNFIFAIPLLISKSLIAYRVMTALLFGTMLVLLYFIVEKRTSASYALCAALFAARFVELATYNMLMMFEALLIMGCLRLKNKKLSSFLIGVLAALAQLTKQSSGGVLLVLITILMIYFAVKDKSIKSVLIYLSGVFIPLFVFLVYLLCTSSFLAFWDCCFFGLFVFGGKNSALYMEGTIPMVLIIVPGIIGDIYFWIKKRDKESLIHLFAGIAVLTNAIPIFENLHLVMGAIFFLIPITYLIKEFAPRYIHINIAPVIVTMVLGIIGFYSYEVISDPRFSDKWTELKYIPSVGDFDYLEPLIKEKSELESEGKHVIVFSDSSVVIYIFDESCDPPYDMLLKGNLGTKDPLDYAKEACSESDNVIFITVNYDEENPQNPDGIYDYVVSNCDLIGTYDQWLILSPKQS